MRQRLLPVLTQPTPCQGGRSEEQRHLEVAPKQPVDVAYPILVIAGQHDSPEFYRPSREFYQVPRAP